MAWGHCCQPSTTLPPPPRPLQLPGPLLSLLQLELHTPSVLCHITQTSVLINPGLKAQLRPLLFKPQPVHGALGGFRWSEVSFFVTQHSGWLYWSYTLCRTHPGPHTFSCSSAPGLLAPLVLRTYCLPPAWHDCNIPFSVHPSVSRSHLGVLRCPASSCCPLLPPSSSQAAAAGHESGSLSIAEIQEGKVSVCLVPISRAPTQLLPWKW